jgi:2-polyprenyl-3-methyl-5-hydroxy-6-metoxy-1,4-benzoquinol methylase
MTANVYSSNTNKSMAHALNEAEWETKYTQGYGNQHVESHIVRIYYHIIRRQYGITNGSLFDWGMGNGINAEFFLREGFRVSGCDISSKAIEKAHARLPGHDDSFKVCSPEDNSLGIPDENFDLFIANESVYYLGDAKVSTFLECIMERMAPKGLILITWISKDHYYFKDSSYSGDGLYSTKVTGRQNEMFMINFKADDEVRKILSQYFKIANSGYYDCVIDEGRRMHNWYLLSL